MCEFTFGENKHWESKIAGIEGILFHALQMLSLTFQNVFWNETIHVLCYLSGQFISFWGVEW